MKNFIRYALISSLSVLLFTSCDPSTEPKVKSSKELANTELISPKDQTVEESTSVTLEWKKIRGAKEYEINVAKDEEFTSTFIDTLIKGTTYKVSSLEYGTTYYWKLYPLKKNQKGPWSDVWSFSTPEDTSQVVSVNLLTPEDNTEISDSTITFDWEPLEVAQEYELQVSTDTTFNETSINSQTTSSSLQTSGLTVNQEYNWRVYPVLDTDSAAWSEVRSFALTEDSTSETTIVQLVSPEDQTSQVPINTQVQWNAVDGASEYQLQVAENSDFSNLYTDQITANTTYELQNLDYEQTYYWRVQVNSDTNEDAWSDIWSFQTEAEPLPVVQLISPDDMATGISVNTQLSWNAVDGYSEYQIQVAQSSSFSSPSIDEITTNTSYDLQNLSYDQTYYWRVQVNSDSNEEAWSNARSFQTEMESTTPSDDSFVTVQNGDFMLEGSVFRFAGTNAYYLPNYEKINEGVVDRALDLFKSTGIKVVRMWAFYDGYDCGYSAEDASENVIQTSPGNYSEEALRDLDNVIAKGKERGIRFILPFLNYWDELGGICQYNTWAGASDPSTNMDFFLNNSQTQQWYKDYVKMLLNRVNTVTGVAYKNEPAIMGWQIMNEGRNSGAEPEILRDWYQEIAQYIKSIDSNHLISTGEEGFDEGTPSEYSESEYSNTYALRANEGTSYIMNTSIPEIDFGNAHWYPTEYGFGYTLDEDMTRAQNAWIGDHKTIAESEGKPFIIGEYGYPGWGDDETATFYDDFYAASESTQLDGNLLWQLTADGTKCWEYGGNICYPDGRSDTQMYNALDAHVSTKTTIQ